MPDSSTTAALSGRWESTTRFGGKGAIAEVMPPAPVESVISRRPPMLRRIEKCTAVYATPDRIAPAHDYLAEIGALSRTSHSQSDASFTADDNAKQFGNAQSS